MSEVDVISKKPITMAELKEQLEKIKKNKELNYRATKTFEYLNQFLHLKNKEAEELKKEIEGLEIGRLKENHIAKIIDIMPETIEELKVIFSGDVTLKQDDLDKILRIVEKYRK